MLVAMPRAVRTLSDLGESALIARIARRAGHSASHSAWPLAIGDDAAILRPRPGVDIVLSTDAQVENVHFRLGRETPRTIGRRAMAVNLSDLAAMGATPVGCLLSLALPRNLELRVFDALISGFVFEAERYACPLVGGNLTRAEQTSLHVAVVGSVKRNSSLRRGRLRVGDELFVTGVLGAAALARHRADRRGSRLTRVPVPRLEIGRQLGRSKATTGCIDLSDGLATDLRNLFAGTGLGAEIDVSSLPSAPGFSRDCRQLGFDPMKLMLEGGEDYELLFSRRSSGRKDGIVRSCARLGLRMTRIGCVVARPGIIGLPEGASSEHHF